MMNIPGIGPFERDRFGTLVSEALPIRAFGNRNCVFALDGYEGDSHPEDFHQAVHNVLAAPESLLLDATPHVLQYCLDIQSLWGDEAPELLISDPADVWRHVDFGSVLVVSRDHGSDRDVFVSIECECAWEAEHGLQLVFKNGCKISKVGPFDGHVSNASAFDDDALDGVIYRTSAK